MLTMNPCLFFVQYAIMTDPKTSRKRKALDLDVKCQVIASVDLGQKSKKDMAAAFGIPKSALRTILKQENSILIINYVMYYFEVAELEKFIMADFRNKHYKPPQMCTTNYCYNVPMMLVPRSSV